MDTDTETTTAKKYKASEIIAALENQEVECDSPHILLYVTEDSCGSMCDLKQHSIATRIGLKMAMLQAGLANLATQVIQDEPEATAALSGAIARSAGDLKKRLLGAALGMMGK